jgi:hypothetical protein
MAVTIDEMHVDVQQGTPPAAAPAQKPSGQQQPTSARREHEMMAERALRLKAD